MLTRLGKRGKGACRSSQKTPSVRGYREMIRHGAYKTGTVLGMQCGRTERTTRPVQTVQTSILKARVAADWRLSSTQKGTDGTGNRDLANGALSAKTTPPLFGTLHPEPELSRPQSTEFTKDMTFFAKRDCSLINAFAFTFLPCSSSSKPCRLAQT